MKPARDGSCSARRACTTTLARPQRTPWRSVSRKSTGFLNRDGAGSTGAGSAGEANAALTTTGRDDCAAGAGTHPETEAMGAAATPVARLESALAHASAPKFVIFGSDAPTWTHVSRDSDLPTIRGSHDCGQTEAHLPPRRADTPCRLASSSQNCLRGRPDLASLLYCRPRSIRPLRSSIVVHSLWTIVWKPGWGR